MMTRRRDLYLLASTDVPFVQDGTRDGEHIREWMHQRFVTGLEARDQPFVVRSGSHDQRLTTVIHHVDALLRTAKSG
ncbi:MAG: hypothetical protein HY329_06610 [Chloroflexi bacterium]|nr:hypothetical protein [Chloroflexota bacterium]